MIRSFTWRQLAARFAVRFAVRALALPVLVFGFAATAGAQGTIAVTVNEAGPRPITQAQVAIVGSNAGGLTGADGKVSLRNVSAGSVTVRVLRVGYGEQKQVVVVVDGQTTNVTFVLTSVAVSLTPVVTTATGDTRRVEIGNAVSTIDVAKLKESAPITNMNDLLNARTPGVAITPGTQTGSASRIRIRGSSSLSLNNDPIYVIDGVRMLSTANTGIGTGDANTSRVGDINPDEIENIEIVKGPSAATLYGTDAANGVIVITTKRGRAGAPRWQISGELGALTDRNPYPWNYTIAGHTPNLTAYRECGLPLISAGTCVKDSLRQYSPLKDPSATPLGTGSRGQLQAQVSGGTDAIRYFVSVGRQAEYGVFKLPDFEKLSLDTLKLPTRKWMDRPNQLDATTVRANISIAASPTLDISVSTGLIYNDYFLGQSSNATAGLGSQGFGGPGYSTNGVVATTGTPLHGYRAWTPAYSFAEKIEQQNGRFIGSANINWRPYSWLQTRLDIGQDYNNRTDQNLLNRGEGPPINATYRLGFSYDLRTTEKNFTANTSATATWNITPSYILKSTVGMQYVDYRREGNGAFGDQLVPGATTPAGGTIFTVSSLYVPSKTLGQFIEEALAVNDRLYLTVAARTDQNSAFGTNFQNVLYPKASMSWVTSDEPWFKTPKALHLDYLRLRAAFGQSGVQPGSTDALRTFGAATVNVRGLDAGGLVYTAIGNSDLKPESTREYEIGFEARFFKGRATLDYTYYDKRTKDALISAIVAPSAGAAINVRRNLGAVGNKGQEMTISMQLLENRHIAMDLTLNGSLNENKLISLGGTPPQIGTTVRAVEGYPLFGLWSKKILGWNDKNGDKILTYNADPNLNEVFVDSVVSYRGPASPTQFFTVTPGIDLFGRKLRLTALFDYRGGNKYYNNTERIRCVSRQNCNGLMNPGSSFEEQAMVVATRNDPSATLDGFFQPGAFVKLRELSATYQLPSFMYGALRARNAAITLSARNVAKWTKYRGVDPENDFTAANAGSNNPADFQTFGAPTYFIFRFNLGY
jgi:TonB-linked SusC/RagA family outer membrane protein